MLSDRLSDITYRRLQDLVTHRFNGTEQERLRGILAAMEYLAYTLADRPVWEAEYSRVAQGGLEEADRFLHELLNEQLVLLERTLHGGQGGHQPDSQ